MARRALVAGAGIGGLTAALALARAGFEVEIFEREPALAEFNLTIGASSAARLERISHLLASSPKPFDTAAFAAMSKDQHDGPNNSLWRTGKGSCTLSSWIVETLAQGAPRLRVVLANPGKPEQTQTFTLDEQFWKTMK